MTKQEFEEKIGSLKQILIERDIVLDDIKIQKSLDGISYIAYIDIKASGRERDGALNISYIPEEDRYTVIVKPNLAPEDENNEPEMTKKFSLDNIKKCLEIERYIYNYLN